ncbi:glycogenin glucosyltransferase [Fusarium falciforme]|nr:glycogenin glucosyltransferase [Fusarium falciforme]
MHSWDAQRQPPPSDSKPEAMNFPSTHYEMSQDTTPFVPPERYPSPPKNMWYEVPKEPPAPPTKAPSEIFPWERNRPPPTRSFAEPLHQSLYQSLSSSPRHSLRWCIREGLHTNLQANLHGNPRENLQGSIRYNSQDNSQDSHLENTPENLWWNLR